MGFGSLFFAEVGSLIGLSFGKGESFANQDGIRHVGWAPIDSACSAIAANGVAGEFVDHDFIRSGIVIDFLDFNNRMDVRSFLGIKMEAKRIGEDFEFRARENGIFIPDRGTDIHGDIIPTLIDELPMIAAMACFAEGDTIIRDAAELKVKESNRIAVMAENLSAMGADVEETVDGMIIHGGKPLHGATIDSHLDHRIAMTFAITAALAEGETEILGAECVNISYPDFYQDLNKLAQ